MNIHDKSHSAKPTLVDIVKKNYLNTVTYKNNCLAFLLTFYICLFQVSAKNLVHEGAGHLPGGLLLHGVRRPAGVRHRQLHRQTDHPTPAAVRRIQEEGQ